MVRYGLVWSGMVRFGPVRSSMVQYGLVWSCMVPYGLEWSSMVQYSSVCSWIWSLMVPYGPVWSRLVLFGPHVGTRFLLLESILYHRVASSYCKKLYPCAPIVHLVISFWTLPVQRLKERKILVKKNAIYCSPPCRNSTLEQFLLGVKSLQK